MAVKDKRFFWELFITTLQLSAFTVGGGFVIVPLMRRKFIREKQWIDEEEMLDLTAIAQSAPGSIAVNASVLLGYRLAGLRGVLVTLFGTVLPPLVILSLVSVFYAAFRHNVYVALAMRGMQAGVAAIILDVVWTMGKNVVSRKRFLPVFIMVGAFAAVWLLDVNVFAVIVVCGVIGVADTFYGERLRRIRFEKKKARREGAFRTGNRRTTRRQTTRRQTTRRRTTSGGTTSGGTGHDLSGTVLVFFPDRTVFHRGRLCRHAADPA